MKFLPLSERPVLSEVEGSESKGFTLVELLVVVSIIAILAVIGLAVFANVQQGARDARRKADISAIANAMEANYNSAVVNCNLEVCVGQYCPLRPCFFSSQQIPTDPVGGAGTTCNNNVCMYCAKSPSAAVGPCAATDQTVGSGQPPLGTGYTVCANLETNTGSGGQFYECRKNQQ